MSKVSPDILEKANHYKANKEDLLKKYEAANYFFIIEMHRLLSVAEFLETKEVEGFKDHIRKAGRYRLDLFKRSKEGKIVPPVRLGILGFSDIYDYLVIGDWDLAKQRVSEIKQENFDIHNSEYLYPFNIILKHILLDSKQEKDLDKVIGEFEQAAKKEMMPYSDATELNECFLFSREIWGFLDCFKGINRRDSTKFMAGIKRIINGYPYYSGMFNPLTLEDKIFGFIPMGLINLARMKGLDVNLRHPLILRELLI